MTFSHLEGLDGSGKSTRREPARGSPGGRRPRRRLNARAGRDRARERFARRCLSATARSRPGPRRRSSPGLRASASKPVPSRPPSTGRRRCSPATTLPPTPGHRPRAGRRPRARAEPEPDPAPPCPTGRSCSPSSRWRRLGAAPCELGPDRARGRDVHEPRLTAPTGSSRASFPQRIPRGRGGQEPQAEVAAEESTRFDSFPEQAEAKLLLAAAIRDGPAHAYLFHGPAGVGCGGRRSLRSELLGGDARVGGARTPTSTCSSRWATRSGSTRPRDPARPPYAPVRGRPADLPRLGHT